MEFGDGSVPSPLPSRLKAPDHFLSPRNLRRVLVRDVPVRSGERSRFRKEALATSGRKQASRFWRKGKIDPIATLYQAWKRLRKRPEASDLRAPVFRAPQVCLNLFVLDVSDSMAKTVDLMRRWLLEYVGRAYIRRDPVAVIVVQGTDAKVLVHPTTSIHFVLHRLSTVSEGGATPLRQGIKMADRMIRQWRDRYAAIELFVMSDGRSTEPLEDLEMANTVALIQRFTRKISVVNPVPKAKPFAQSLASLLGGTYLEPGEFTFF